MSNHELNEFNELARKADEHGGMAFPSQCERGAAVVNFHGMTLRDWFAGHALSGLMAADEVRGEKAVKEAWALADEMLKQRPVRG